MSTRHDEPMIPDLDTIAVMVRIATAKAQQAETRSCRLGGLLDRLRRRGGGDQSRLEQWALEQARAEGEATGYHTMLMSCQMWRSNARS